jgi:hypothetical protein
MKDVNFSVARKLIAGCIGMLFASLISAETLTGFVKGPDNLPIPDALVSFMGVQGVRTLKDGSF